MKTFIYYLALGLQLLGMASVGLCLMVGLSKGDYGRIELAQFVGGAAIFYFGQGLKRWSALS